MKTFNNFVKYYKPYLFLLILDLICASIISIVDIGFPLILNVCAHNIFLKDHAYIVSFLPKLGIGLLFMYILRACCKYFVACQGHVMGAQMERDMRKELFDQYQRLSFSYYDNHNTGVMMSRISSDLFDISEFAHHGPENLFISFLKIIGSFMILSFIYFPLAFMLFLVTLCMLFFSYKKNKAMRRTFDDNRKKIGLVNASVQDSLAGIRVVQSFTNENIEKLKFKEANEKFLASKKDNYRIMGQFTAGNNFFQGVLYIVVLLGGGYFIVNGSLSPLDLATFALYIGIFVSPIEVLVELTEMFQKGLSGFRRFEEVVEIVPDVLDCDSPIELKNVKGDIEFCDVSFQYTEQEDVLCHINLSIKSGQNLAMIGPSGSGKTTLCSLIPRFYDVIDGCITIDGIDIRKYSLKSLRSNIGIVQQEVYLFGGSIAQNIGYGKENATMEEIIEAAKKANIHKFILSLPDGYETYVGERGARLSGGQKQRISIARLFLKDPKILILDEATSALDNESERIIQKSLEELSKGRTCITIAHRLSTIRNANEIVVVDATGIHERGSHDDLMKLNGIYANYYRLQFDKII